MVSHVKYLVRMKCTLDEIGLMRRRFGDVPEPVHPHEPALIDRMVGVPRRNGRYLEVVGALKNITAAFGFRALPNTMEQ